MKNDIALLILAHHNPEQLSVLINHLKNDFDLYIQIDKKSSLNINELPSGRNVNYYKEIEVYWGDFSQVHNMHFILKKAYHNGYQHYLFISGDDLPIKSNTYIKNFLNQKKDAIYMYANPLPIKTWGFNHGYDRLDRYWFMGMNNRKNVKIIGRITLMLQRFFRIKIKRFSTDYYAGSNWLNLTHDSVSYLFSFLKENPSYLKKLKYSRATDEIWVQSVLMNSTFKKHVVNHDMRYIDWETGPDFPRIFDETDIEKIKNSEALFGRKFKLKSENKFIEKFLDGLNNIN